MTLVIDCLDENSPCEAKIEGDSIGELIVVMCKHSIAVHGFSEADIDNPEMRDRMRAAVMHSTRPAQFRTLKRYF